MVRGEGGRGKGEGGKGGKGGNGKGEREWEGVSLELSKLIPIRARSVLEANLALGPATKIFCWSKKYWCEV